MPRIGESWRGQIRDISGHWSPTHPDQRPRRPTKINIVVLVWISAYGCNVLWRFEWHHWRPWPTSAAGNITAWSRFAERTGLSCQYSLSVVNNLSFDTRDKIFPQCRWYRSEITKKPKIYHGVNDTGEKLFTGVNDSAEKFFIGDVDTADKPVLPILACLHLKLKNKQKIYL